MIDEFYMKRCLSLAKKGIGYTSPNPLVGCVIVYNNKIIGEGWHKNYGESHAEVNAIKSVNDTSVLNKSTIYINLEPCNHYGKTPPCSELIIKYKIPKLVIGVKDPNNNARAGEHANAQVPEPPSLPVPSTSKHYDICIIGAGPAGLSVLSAIQQPLGIIKHEHQWNHKNPFQTKSFERRSQKVLEHFPITVAESY